MAEPRHPDGTVAVRSARLVAELERAGCRSLGRRHDGMFLFAATDTVKRIVKEYADRADMARARQSFRNEPRIVR